MSKRAKPGKKLLRFDGKFNEKIRLLIQAKRKELGLTCNSEEISQPYPERKIRNSSKPKFFRKVKNIMSKRKKSYFRRKH